MQYSKAKASSFPYVVMLCVVLVQLILSALSIAFVLHKAPSPGDAGQIQKAATLYMTLGSSIGFLVMSAAFSLAGTQWMLERRNVAELPRIAAVCIAGLCGALSAAWGFLVAFLMGIAASNMAWTTLVHVVFPFQKLLGCVIPELLILFSVWLVFRLFRRQEVPMAGMADLRGRALLVFGLLSWWWIMPVLSFVVPVAAMRFLDVDADANPMTLFLGPYAGSMVLALPAFLGAMFGFPVRMHVVRPTRLCFTAALAMLVNILVLMALAAVAAMLSYAMDNDAKPGIGIAVLVQLVWLAASTLLCRLLVKALMPKTYLPESNEQRSVPAAAASN